MNCKVEYVCMPSFGPLHHHNILINDEKWHKIGKENPPSSREDIINEVKSFKCKKKELILFNYEEGWIHECQNE